MNLADYRAWYLEFPPPAGAEDLIHQSFVLRDQAVLTSVIKARLATPFPVFRVCPEFDQVGPVHTEFRLPDQDVQIENPVLSGWVFGFRFTCMIETRPGFSLAALRTDLARAFIGFDPDAPKITDFKPVLETLYRLVLPEITAMGMIADPSGSERTKRRHFLRKQGMPPKPFSDLRRFQLVLKDIAQTNRPLVALAQDYGYADQAHLTRDFIRRTGMSPAKFRKSWTTDHHVHFLQETDQEEGIGFGILVE